MTSVSDLYAQYTAETNQPFTPAAIKKIHEKTGGQTWLVNRLGTILTVDVKPGTVEPINETDVDQAIQILLHERNDHFDNLYEKAKLHKETFVEIVFDHVKYKPDNEDQSWLEQYGLIRKQDYKAVPANDIYKERYLETFFDETKVPESVSGLDYRLPDDAGLDMERILMQFEQYIAEIVVQAFYQKKKPYEKTGQFLLTAWLYQFVKAGAGELRYEVPSGLGRLDVLLTYKGKRYIIETKLNRRKLTRTISDGVTQVAGKYLASQSAQEGYLVVFDTKIPVGEECDPQYHTVGDKKVTCIIIPTGQVD